MHIFREFVEPILDSLHGLLEPGKSTFIPLFFLLTLLEGVLRDEIWRNDFCRYVMLPICFMATIFAQINTRHLSFVRNAFSGIPTLAKEVISPEELQAALDSSDIL